MVVIVEYFNSLSTTNKVILSLSVGAISVGASIYIYYKYVAAKVKEEVAVVSDPIETEVLVESGRVKKYIGEVSSIILYPIKSGPPLEVTEAELTASGLKYQNLYDRRFVLVGEKSFVSIRCNMRMIDLALMYDQPNECIIVTAPGDVEDLHIPLDQSQFNPNLVKQFEWYDKRMTNYLDCGDKFADWFTIYLGQPCRLGFYHPDMDVREINPEFRYNHTDVHPGTKLMFQNTHPYLFCTTSSLEDLNSRLIEPINFKQFRPNIVIETADADVEPYEEDSWREIETESGALFFNERPCPRCPMIYVDYARKTMQAKKEPMKTLLTYRRGERKDKSKTVFGINVSLIKPGSIKLGEKMLV